MYLKILMIFYDAYVINLPFYSLVVHILNDRNMTFKLLILYTLSIDPVWQI